MAGSLNGANKNCNTLSNESLASNEIECWSKEKKLEKLANYSACQVVKNSRLF
jgi:hypothetical protein